MKKHHVIGKTLVFAGLTLAVLLGVAGLRSHRTTIKLAGKSASITELDQRARPFFEEAQRNVPAAVAKLTETKTLAKICWLEVRDKASGSHELQKLVQSFLEKPILEPCRKGASVYGCAINSEAARQNVSDVGSGAVTTVLYSTAGLALEAVFLKSTPSLHAFGSRRYYRTPVVRAWERSRARRCRWSASSW